MSVIICGGLRAALAAIMSLVKKYTTQKNVLVNCIEMRCTNKIHLRTQWAKTRITLTFSGILHTRIVYSCLKVSYLCT